MPDRFVALDGLRGIAALLILMGHYQAVLGQSGALRLRICRANTFFPAQRVRADAAVRGCPPAGRGGLSRGLALPRTWAIAGAAAAR